MFGVAGPRLQLLRSSKDGPGSVWFSYWIWSAIGIIGHALGGFLIGAALAAIGRLLSLSEFPYGPILLALGCVACGIREFGLIKWPMPQLHRQVPRAWMRTLPWNVTIFGYGLQLGSAIATRVTVATTYVVLGSALLSGSFLVGGVLVGVFGLARSLMPLCFVKPLASPMQSMALAESLTRHERWIKNANALALFAAGVVFVISRGRS